MDDHAVVREGIIRILERNLEPPVTCGQAATAREAVQELARNQYGLVLLDVSLPGTNGLDLLGTLHGAHPEVKVLIVSMHAEEQYAMRALALGAAGYLTKESAPAELVTAVNRVISGGRYISSSLADRLADRMIFGKSVVLPHEALSLRECQVLTMIGSGKSPKEIAYELSISDKTVSTYRTRVLRKLGMRSTAEMMSYAIKHLLC